MTHSSHDRGTSYWIVNALAFTLLAGYIVTLTCAGLWYGNGVDLEVRVCEGAVGIFSGDPNADGHWIRHWGDVPDGFFLRSKWPPTIVTPCLVPKRGSIGKVTITHIPLWPLVVLAVATAAVQQWKYRKRRTGPDTCLCGYSLQGNQSGTCPECGSPILNRSRPPSAPKVRAAPSPTSRIDASPPKCPAI